MGQWVKALAAKADKSEFYLWNLHGWTETNSASHMSLPTINI